MMISAVTVVVLILVLAIASSIQAFADTASTGPKQEQQQQQLATLASNANNTIGNDSRLLSPSSFSPTSNIRPNIQTDFNPNVTSPRISQYAYIDLLC